MREFETKYRVDRNTQILQSENAFRDDVDLRLHLLETASQMLGLAANEARDAIIRNFDLEIAPRLAQLVTILGQYDGNANALRDAVLALVRDGVEARGDTLKKMMALIDANTAGMQELAADFTGIAALLDGKANSNHTHTMTQVLGLMDALSDRLTRANNLLELSDPSAARANLGLGSAATRNTGNTANTIPLLDATGMLIAQRIANSAGWGVVTQSVGASNPSGIYFDGSNNALLDIRNGAGALRSRWSSNDPNGHLLDGYIVFGCRAWVNFNGSTGAIRGSGNVSSITRNATGDYYVNFATAMPDVNYSVVATCAREGGNYGTCANFHDTDVSLTNRVRIVTATPAVGLYDPSTVAVAIFR